MEHSKKFDEINKFYNTIVNGKRLWSIAMVRKAVQKGWITAEEFREITGEDYEEAYSNE